jgi:hypothetical protein
MGYTPAANVAITEATQFTSKTYVDTAGATKLNLSGGTLTGALTLSGAPTSNLHAATKAYVDDKVAAGGGALPDEIKTSDSSTSVKTTLTGVEIRDDTTLIATISKDSTATKLKGNLDGTVIATNDLTIKNKDESSTIATFNTTQIQTSTSILQNATQGS